MLRCSCYIVLFVLVHVVYPVNNEDTLSILPTAYVPYTHSLTDDEYLVSTGQISSTTDTVVTSSIDSSLSSHVITISYSVESIPATTSVESTVLLNGNSTTSLIENSTSSMIGNSTSVLVETYVRSAILTQSATSYIVQYTSNSSLVTSSTVQSSTIHGTVPSTVPSVVASIVSSTVVNSVTSTVANGNAVGTVSSSSVVASTVSSSNVVASTVSSSVVGTVSSSSVVTSTVSSSAVGIVSSSNVVASSVASAVVTGTVSSSSNVATPTPVTNAPPITNPSEGTADHINPTTPPGESEETIASISIFFILILLAISVVIVHLFIKYQFHYLPESIALVLLGFVVGFIMFIINLCGYDYQYQEKFSPQFFFLVLLPPIIFESGYSLHKGNFFQNLGSIVMFAVLGTAISAVIVGGGIYFLGVMGVIYKLDLIQSFTFGSLISAVDPVATLAIFHALHVDPTLNMLVFGESVLNDAVSIVLTKTILNQLPTNGTTGVPSDQSAAHVLGNSAWQFCVMFFGSALLGVIFALISALFLKLINLRRHQSLEFSMWVIFAFAPYFLAEGLHLSGIMAVLFCGIVMSHYTHYNLSAVTQITVQQALRTVAFMAESGVFLYLGLAVFSINKSFDLALIVWSIVLILIGRAANIFPLTFLMNCCRSVKISLRMQCIMWYSGLRGAVAFALAMNLKEYFSDEVTGYIVTTTLIIVLFTIVILGGSTLPLLKFLKADKGAKLTLSKTEEQDLAVSRQTLEDTFSSPSYRRIHGCSQGFMYLDYNYIRPFFIRRFTREEVKASQFEMQQKTVEWYKGLREASHSDEDVDIIQETAEEGSTVSTLLS